MEENKILIAAINTHAMELTREELELVLRYIYALEDLRK